MTGVRRRGITVFMIGAFGLVANLSLARAADPGAELLAQSHDAATTTQFSGDVVTEWTDSGGRHRQQVHVVGKPGALHVGSQSIVSTGDRSLVRYGGDWLVLWNAKSQGSAPSADRKYSLSVKRGPLVAGRSTTVIRASLERSDGVAERLYLDVDTSLLLRREVLDAHGKVSRSISFTKISAVVTAPPSTKVSLPKLASDASRDTPRSVTKVGRVFHAPRDLGRGYRLVGRYRHPNGTLQLLYSDGLFSMSLFEQRGVLEWSALPAGGTEQRLAGRTVRVYQSAGSAAAVWSRDGLVLTCITDAPLTDIAGAVDSMRPGNRGGLWPWIAESVLGPFSWG